MVRGLDGILAAEFMSEVADGDDPSVAPRRVVRPRRVFVTGLELVGSLGIYEHEHRRRQRVIVSVDLLVEDTYDGVSDTITAVYDYDRAIAAISRTVESRHYNLIETLAEEIATLCLADDTVRQVTVRIEKPEVLTSARAIGIEIVRTR